MSASSATLSSSFDRLSVEAVCSWLTAVSAAAREAARCSAMPLLNASLSCSAHCS